MTSSKSNRIPSPGLLVGVIALVLALAGSAVALPGKGSVDKNDLAKGAVTKKAIKKGAVTKKALAANAVATSALADGAVTTPKLASGAVEGGKIAASAVDGAKIAAGAVDGGKIADGVVTTAKLAPEARTYSLRVAVDGSSFGGSPGVSSERVGAGLYFVRFPVSVRNYALVASPSGGAENADARVYINRCGGGPGEIGGCSPPAVNNNPQTLFIETNDDGDAANEDLSFDIAATP